MVDRDDREPRAPGRRVRSAILLTALCLLIFAIACGRLGALFPTKIGDIQKDPRKYDGKTVTIEGEVTEAMNVLVMRYYTVSDGTGQMRVLPSGAVPQVGSDVKVRGTVSQAFVMGDKTLLVLFEEKR